MEKSSAEGMQVPDSVVDGSGRWGWVVAIEAALQKSAYRCAARYAVGYVQSMQARSVCPGPIPDAWRAYATLRLR
jgi:hypothetical protein